VFYKLDLSHTISSVSYEDVPIRALASAPRGSKGLIKNYNVICLL